MPATLLRPRVKSRLERALDGELHTSALWKGIYARDASIYEVEPLGVVVPRSMEDVRRVVEIAGDADLSVLPRGAGTSQAGQSVNRALVVDTSVHLRRVVDLDPRAGVVRIEPGIVLDALNRVLRPHGQFFPVDVATAARATLGGMVGNDSAGARSIRYGTTADHVRAVRTLLADGREAWLPARAGAVPEGFGPVQARIADIRERVTRQLRTRIPHVPRHVAGYGLHRIGAAAEDLGQLLVGSEGTLGFFTELELSTAPLPERRVLGVCAFRDVRSALAAVADITALGPSAVELIDRIILDQARAVPGLRERVDRFAAADAGALLVVEFEGADGPEALESLHSLCAERHGWMGWTSALEPALQADVWAVRKTGLNLSMRTSGPRTRIPFIEDCAVPVDRLPEFHDRMVAVFEHHGVSSVFYAHASVGLLHIRPGLDLADPADRVRLREISTETAAIVKDLSGSFSGEHGDGIVRAGAIEPMLGRRLAGAFREVKAAFDPASRFNPGRIVDAPAMDDPALLHAARPLRPSAARPGLEWGDGGVLAMASACNQNGTCRKHDVGTMCPSYRVTRDERHAPRGRANALRLALSGRLGGVSDPDLHAALDLCVGCKACRRECPMQVDVSRLKIEALHQRRRAGHRPRLRTRMFAELPRRAPVLSRLGALQGLLPRTLLGLAAGRRLPRWSRTPFSDAELAEGPPDGRPVVLFVDTFTRWFEPENARAAIRVLRASGYSVRTVQGEGGPLCCGRTYLSAGWVDEARAVLRSTLDALEPVIDVGIPVVGLEPSCVLTFRDEVEALLPERAQRARAVRLITELELGARMNGCGADAALLHGHCHEKAFGVDGVAVQTLERVPGLEVRALDAGCCGMAGSFGYEAEHDAVSRAMADLALAPAVQAAAPDTLIVANGTSCRAQIRDLTGREALHTIRVLDRALMNTGDSDGSLAS